MVAKNDKWGDLAVRVGSGIVLIAVGVVGIWSGGHLFNGMVAVICGLMIWELTVMLAPQQRDLALQMGGVSALATLLAVYLPLGYALPLLFAPAIVGVGQLKHHPSVFMLFATLILLAGFGMCEVRDDLGFAWMLWLVLVVVVTDVAGYFAGRLIGGPKFWPRVSPKKTWAGTSAGWLGAGLVGLGFAVQTDAGMGLVGVSVAVSMASQMGDIAESAIKRWIGVKDSSSLIPGHGGLLDRFDGMLGASLFLLVIRNAYLESPIVVV